MRSIAIVIQPDALPDKLPLVPEIKEGPAAATSSLNKAEKLNRQATELMIKGRDALLLFDSAVAIEAFNNVLRLPSNKYTQDAQEWLGVANEDAGRPEQARATYVLYLKRYTKGEGVVRVKKRLANLSAMQSALLAKEAVRAPLPAAPATIAVLPPAAVSPMPVAQAESATSSSAVFLFGGN